MKSVNKYITAIIFSTWKHSSSILEPNRPIWSQEVHEEAFKDGRLHEM